MKMKNEGQLNLYEDKENKDLKIVDELECYP